MVCIHTANESAFSRSQTFFHICVHGLPDRSSFREGLR